MDSIEVELMASQAMNEHMAQTIGEQDAEIARLRTALAEAQRERDELRADLVFAVENAVMTNESRSRVTWLTDDDVHGLDWDGTAADLCRAIREARVS